MFDGDTKLKIKLNRFKKKEPLLISLKEHIIFKTSVTQ